jgi:AcrR family transcriptional regulator
MASVSARRTRVATQRRERLLDAVSWCICDRGYHDATVDAVVARARTSKSAFYEFFPGKEAAFAALLEREGERVLRALTAAMKTERDPRRRAGAGIATFVRSCTRDVSVARILLLEAVGTSPLVEERRRALHARYAALVREQIEAAGGGAVVSEDGIDFDVLAFAIIGAVNEAVVHLLEAGGDAERVIASLEHLVNKGLEP